jgi:hypothetical protein
MLEVAVVPAMELDVPATAPIEELASADPGKLGGPTAREEPPLDEPGQGPKPQVVAKLLGRATQDRRQLVRDLTHKKGDTVSCPTAGPRPREIEDFTWQT